MQNLKDDKRSLSISLSLSSLLSAKAKEFKGAKVRPEKH